MGFPYGKRPEVNASVVLPAIANAVAPTLRNWWGIGLVTVCAVIGWSAEAYAECVVNTSTPTYLNGKLVDTQCDEQGKTKTASTLTGTLAGEDISNDVMKMEERYLTIPAGGTDAMVAADQLYKTGTGYVRSITCYSDAAATAGTIALRDNIAAGAGDILWSFDVLAVAYTTPFTVELQTPFVVGLYLDFTTTADVKCMVRYR